MNQIIKNIEPWEAHRYKPDTDIPKGTRVVVLTNCNLVKGNTKEIGEVLEVDVFNYYSIIEQKDNAKYNIKKLAPFFIPEQWYKYSSCNMKYYIKPQNVNVGGLKGNQIKGRMYGSFEGWTNLEFLKNCTVLEDLTEIQEFLPNGHVDKIIEKEFILPEKWCIKKENSIISYLNTYLENNKHKYPSQNEKWGVTYDGKNINYFHSEERKKSHSILYKDPYFTEITLEQFENHVLPSIKNEQVVLDPKVGDFVITKEYSEKYDGRILEITNITERDAYKFYHFKVHDNKEYNINCNFTYNNIIKILSKEEALIEIAKQRYPIGTKFYPAHVPKGSCYCVISTDKFQFEKDYMCAELPNGTEWNDGKSYGNTKISRVVYGNGKWAEIIEETNNVFIPAKDKPFYVVVTEENKDVLRAWSKLNVLRVWNIVGLVKRDKEPDLDISFDQSISITKEHGYTFGNEITFEQFLDLYPEYKEKQAVNKDIWNQDTLNALAGLGVKLQQGVFITHSDRPLTPSECFPPLTKTLILKKKKVYLHTASDMKKVNTTITIKKQKR